FAVLAGRLREQLLGPEAEVAGVRVDRDLVAALLPAGTEVEAQLEAWVPIGPVAGLGHLVDTVEQPLEVDPEQRGRDHPEHRQRRVTSPDRRLAVEDTEEPALPG